MKVYKAKTFADLYKLSLTDLITNPEYETCPREMKIKEICDVALILEDPTSCLYSNEVRSSQYKYIAAEFLWYFMGRNDAEYISKYAKFWENIKNDDGTVNSSYGYLLFANKNKYDFSQYQWAYESLLKDKDSRQAVLHFNLTDHQHNANKDFVCTMYGIFQIRNNKLNFTVSMRSNDVILGLPTDIAFFTTLQSQMLYHLKLNSKYSDLELGTYTHIANSFHVYERHYDLINRMLTFEFKEEVLPQVNLSFINVFGDPTEDFKYIFNNLDSTSNDLLFNWIIKNINK